MKVFQTVIKADIGHNHVEADILDLDKYTQAEVNTVSGSLQTNIDGKSDTGHTHIEADITDLDKYTQAEVNTISGSLQTKVNDKEDKHIGINTPDLSSNNYTLILSDDGKFIEMNKATAVTLTVPTSSEVAFSIGTTVSFRQTGVGQVTITPVDGTVTIDSQDGFVTTSQHAMVAIFKVATNTWVAAGSLE